MPSLRTSHSMVLPMARIISVPLTRGMCEDVKIEEKNLTFAPLNQ